ncbi:MAG: protoporphyrinogen oxidase [Ilumatobacteraceae bacterium]
MPTAERIVVIGGGITGVAATHRLVTLTSGTDTEIVLLEAEERLGGKIRTSRFGASLIDESADAFLLRTPYAVQLASTVGLGEQLVSPTSASAGIWAGKLYPIPSDLALGVPTSLTAIARSGLLPTTALARAALDLVRPRSSVDHDSIGEWARSRFGYHVHDRLIDALVGSIYGADTDRFSLQAVPQLHSLSQAGRSALISGRKLRKVAPPQGGPIFGAPPLGMEQLIHSTVAALQQHSEERARVISGSPCQSLQQTNNRWMVNDIEADGVIVATPAHHASRLFDGDLRTALGSFDTSDVAIVTVRVAANEWPEHLQNRSGYLIPKSQQRLVTAVSFASQKWSHLAQDDGSQILRISLGRDALPIDHLSDADLVNHAIEETSQQLGIHIDHAETRVSRWAHAFTQYRPHHAERVAAIDGLLPRHLQLAGSSYRGIGIPACIADGTRAAEELLVSMAN